MSSASNKRAGSNKALIVILVILVVIIAVGIGVIVYLLNKKEEPVATPATGRGTVITEENLGDADQALQGAPVEDGFFQTEQTIDWHFDSKGVTEDAYIANSVNNSRTVYFDLIMENSNELIYSSPYIPVGKSLEGFTLDKPLKEGTYDTVMVYHLVDDAENELSTLSVAITIYVE